MTDIHECVHDCRNAELGFICTDQTIVIPTGDHLGLCPPESDCIDAVMHRTVDRDWHTCQGTGPAQWWQQWRDEKEATA